MAQDNNLLERGQMLTGHYGSRYVVREFLQKKNRCEIYEASEGSTIVWAVVCIGGSERYRKEFIEDTTVAPVRAREYSWPIDCFGFDKGVKKYFGYIIEVPEGKWFNYDVIASKLPNDYRAGIGYNLAKAYNKLHLLSHVFGEKPAVWVDNKYNVRLIGLPVPEFSRYYRDDFIGLGGYNAPELFATNQVCAPTVQSDRFTLAVLLFEMMIGIVPYEDWDKPDIKRRILLGMTRPKFIFRDPEEGYRETYSHAILSRWDALTDQMKEYFILSFTTGLDEPNARITEEQWADELRQITWVEVE